VTLVSRTLLDRYELAGDRGDAERMLAEMEEKAKTGYVPMATMVQLHLALGDVDGSFESLEKAFACRASFMMPLSVYPFFDSIRGDPRFDDLLRRQKAPS
jgi:hypothetical protein